MKVWTPRPQVRTRTRQLRNLHETVDLLRQALHRLKLTAKLRAQLAAATPAPAAPPGAPNGAAAATGGGVSAIDLAKAAKLVADVGAVEEEGDLSGLAVLDADAGLLATAGQLIRTQADVRCSRESLGHAPAHACALGLRWLCWLLCSGPDSSKASFGPLPQSMPSGRDCRFCDGCLVVECSRLPAARTRPVQEALRKGMDSLSQAEVGSALQVYFNLGQLRQVSGLSATVSFWRWPSYTCSLRSRDTRQLQRSLRCCCNLLQRRL